MGHQRGAEHALQQAEGDHLLDALRDAAQHRGDGETGGADDEQLLAPEPHRHPAERRGHDRRRDDVGGQHPVDLILRRRERSLHVGQGDVGDGGVERLHDGRHHHADRQQRALERRDRIGLAKALMAWRRPRAPERARTSDSPQARMRSARPCSERVRPGVDRDVGAHAGAQAGHVLIGVEAEAQRNALHDLDPIAAGVLRRQDRELRAGAGRDRTDGAMPFPAGERVDRHRRGQAGVNVGQVGFLRVAVDPEAGVGDDREDGLTGVRDAAELDLRRPASRRRRSAPSRWRSRDCARRPRPAPSPACRRGRSRSARRVRRRASPCAASCCWRTNSRICLAWTRAAADVSASTRVTECEAISACLRS